MGILNLFIHWQLNICICKYSSVPRPCLWGEAILHSSLLWASHGVFPAPGIKDGVFLDGLKKPSALYKGHFRNVQIGENYSRQDYSNFSLYILQHVSRTALSSEGCNAARGFTLPKRLGSSREPQGCWALLRPCHACLMWAQDSRNHWQKKIK